MRKIIIWIWKHLPQRVQRLLSILIAMVGCVLLAGLGYLGLQLYSETLSDSNSFIHRWFSQPETRNDLITTRKPCPNAPFLLPSDGFIGLLWNDPAAPYTMFRRHTGIDIFGDGQAGEVPVYAAYEGYLTRLPDWLSTVIIQHADPLEEGRTIWTYYTHMASRDGSKSFVVADFPAGTAGVWVEQGTLLGYQGEYSGSSSTGIGLHVHVSIVLSDHNGSFKNETTLENTLDPSPYFGMSLNIDDLPDRPIQCQVEAE